MSKNNGGQAFPVAGSEHNYPIEGMTMRDYFAAKAMASIVRRWDGHGFGGGQESPEHKELARDAYFIADAMLKARGDE